MFKEAVIAYLILIFGIAVFTGCAFYYRSFHNDEPLSFIKEEKCVGIKCQNIANIKDIKDADDADANS